MNVVRFDRRAAHFIESKPQALDRDNDLRSLAGEQYRHLERLHMAFWRNDAPVFLDALTKANEIRVAVRVIAQADAERIEAAPDVSKEQIELWASGIAA